MARVRLQDQRRVPVLREPQGLEQQARQPEQPPQALPPPVPLRQERQQQQLVVQQPQEQQPVLPPAQVLQQQLVRQPVHGAAQLGWGSARRSVCWQANFSKE
ncbi:hypothetical protein [Serratia proteamaculans]|uniref:hypothetical protein n=1 Tax=Serratia proteamaculans TaxID=28151 RepID=UPI0039B01CB5